MTDGTDLRVDMKIDGTWTDITDDVYFDGGLSYTRGRSGEGTKVDPGLVTMKLKSPNFEYTPRHPLSPNFGKIGRNTEVRASAGGAGVVLELPVGGDQSRATTPDTAALDITGDLDVRVDAALDDWTADGPFELISKSSSILDQRSWLLTVWKKKLLFYWSPDGTSAAEQSEESIPFLVPPSGRMAVRLTLDVNNGASGHTLRFYTAPTLAGPWVQLGTSLVIAGITSIFASTAPLTVGAAAGHGFATADGHVYAAEVRNGIGGTVVANPNFSAQTAGAPSFTDSAGRLWTMENGALLTDRRTRLVVEVPSWSPRWTSTGADLNVPIQGGGILRRLGQGAKALDSTLRRRVPSYSPIAYWPCEDADGATQAYSPIEGVNPLNVRLWRFGQDDTLPGSAAVPSVEAGGAMVGTVPPPPAATVDPEFSVHMIYAVDSIPAAEGVFLSFTSNGTVRRWQIVQGPGVVRIQGFDRVGDMIVNKGIAVGSDIYEGWQRLAFWVRQTGSTVEYRVDYYNIGGGAGGLGDTFTGSVGRVTGINTVFSASATGLRVGHVAVMPVALSAAYSGAENGFAGETAGARALRLADEENLPLTLIGDPATMVPMGPQRPDTLLNLLAECEQSDGGILYEDRDRLALVLRSRQSLYNQEPALLLPYSSIVQPFEPVDDDSRIRNDVTRARTGGSSARVIREDGPLSVQPPPLGVGIYDESQTLSLHNDAQPYDIAAWAMHLGTWDEARYKTVRILLHKHPELIDGVTALDVGSIIRITDIPSFLPPGPIDLLVEGYREDQTGLTWDIAFACSPAGPWTVGVLEDPVLGKADTDGSELAAAVTATATTLEVAVTDGPLWVTAAPNQIADPGFEQGIGTWRCSRGTGIGVTSWDRDVVHSGTGAVRLTRVHLTDTGTLNLLDDNGWTAAAAGQAWTGSAWVYSGGAAVNSLRVAFIWRDAGGLTTNVSGPGVNTQAGDGWVRLTVSGIAPAGMTSVRLLVEGRSAWTVGEWWVCDDVRLARTDTLVGTDMPTEFPFEVTVGGEVVNVHGISGTSSPQTFHVDRSRNGITKPQATGTSLSLTNPMRAAL